MARLQHLENAAVDLVAGAAAFGVFYAGLRWVPDNDASIVVLLVEAIYFAGGIFRGNKNVHASLTRLLLIVAPGIGVILAFAYTGYAFTSHLYIICFIGAALFGVLSGILLRRFFAARKMVLCSLTAAGVLALSLLAIGIVIPREVAASLSKDADLPAPSFTFSAIDGAVVGSDRLHGRVVVLAFWATWCRPCIGELPRIQQVYQRFRNDPRVGIWVIDSGIGNDTAEKQRRMISAQRWDLPFAEDSENLEYKMGLRGLPKIVLLDKTGRIRWVHDGFDGSEDLARNLTNRIEQLLRSG